MPFNKPAERGREIAAADAEEPREAVPQKAIVSPHELTIAFVDFCPCEARAAIGRVFGH